MNQIENLGHIAADLGSKVLFQEPMSKHTTFKIGGPADLFVTVHNRIALQKLIKAANDAQIPFLAIGNGSNMLVKDSGIRGLVIALDDEFQKIRLLDKDRIECGSGATLAGLCNFAKDNSLSGLEFAWGIPGSAGGAAFMNAGAYGGEMKQVLVSCKHMTTAGEIAVLSGDELQLSYRKSAYSTNQAIILSLTLQMQKGSQEQIMITMEDLLNRRKSKQPLEYPSAGSVFKRPEGNFAGTLIEQCGLKGKRIGGAMVSPKHAGFIVNDGGATCEDVLRLIEFIQNTVLRQTGVALECEIKTIGG